MAFAHPATYYVRYLMLVHADPSREAVNSQLELYGIAELKAKQYDEIAENMTNPPPSLRLHDRRHRASVTWLRSMRIYGLVHRDKVIDQVFRQVLRYRNVREALERLILGRVSSNEAAYRLREIGVRVSDSVIEEFAHFFWNMDVMGLADWATYLAQDSLKGRTGPVREAYLAALHGGPELAMYRAGIRVEVDSKKVLEEIHTELAMTFREVKDLPLSQKKVEMLGTLTRNICKVDERLGASDSALQDVLRRFEKFKVVSEEGEPPSLIELAPSGTVSDTSRAEILRSREH